MPTLPRVSEVLRILDNAYEDVPQGVLDAAAERGTILHGLCCQHLASMMDLCPKPAEIEAEYAAAYLGFLEWVEARDVRPRLVEMSSVNEKEGYTGTPDTLVTYGDDPALRLVDLKFTASILRINHVQVGAYRKLRDYADAQHGAIVHINHQTGQWDEIDVKQNPRDWYAFLNALAIYNWRQA